MFVAMLFVVGCAADLPPLPPPPVPPPCEGAPDACAACFVEQGYGETAELVRASAALEAQLDALEAQVLDRCESLARRFELEDPPEGLPRCDAVAEEIERRVVELFPIGVQLAVVVEPTRCVVDEAIARECLVECGDADAELACLGERVGACDGTCDGVCQGACDGACVGVCSDFCDGACDGLCIGQCDGTCDLLDRDARCIATCDGICARSVCDGTCDGACEGVCTAPCAGACEGACVGSCDGDWSPTCDGVVEARSARCGLGCTARAAIVAECPIPQLRVRGPEVEDPRSHPAVDQVTVGMGRDLDEFVSVRAHLALLLAPWSSALADALDGGAALEPESCLVDAASRTTSAITRAEALAGITDRMRAAAEDAVGTLPD